MLLNKAIVYLFCNDFFFFFFLSIYKFSTCSPSDKPPESIGMVNGETLQQVI